MLKEVGIEGEVVDVILQGGWHKGNINNMYSMEDQHSNMGVVTYNLTTHHNISMDEVLTTKSSSTRPQM